MPNYRIIHITGNTDPGTSLDLGQIGYRTDTNELFIGNGIGNLPKKFLTGDINTLALITGAVFQYPITCNNNDLFNSSYNIINGDVTINFDPYISKNYSLEENGYANITLDTTNAKIGDYIVINCPPNTPIQSLIYNGTIFRQKNLSVTSVYALDFNKYRTFYIRYGGNNRIFITSNIYD